MPRMKMKPAPSSAPTPTPMSTPKGPDPTSVFVLFEGPWVIDQLSQGVLRATTFDQLTTGDEMAAAHHMHHDCLVGFGDDQGALVNPIGVGQPALSLNPGEKWCITTPTPLLSQSKQIADLFGVSFNRKTDNDVFVFVKNPVKAMCVTPRQSEDRVVLFPTPDNVYLAGRVLTGTVNHADGSLLNQDPIGRQTPMPHIAVIFEYTKQSGANLSLTLGGAAVVPLVEGRHLIFRMVHEHDGKTSQKGDVGHIEAAFDAIWSRVETNGQLSLTGVTDTSYCLGRNTAGFNVYELGLELPIIRSETPANCGGGGLILC